MSKTGNRRELIEWAAAGAAMTLCAPGTAGAQDCGLRPMLRRGDRIDLAGREEQVLERAYRFGYDYQKRCGGCAQCAVAALQDALPFVPAEVNLFRGAACLDGGATPKGVQNCGSFTGAAMVIGHLCGRTRDEIFFGENGLCHELVRKLYQRFEAQYGSVLCQDVRERAKGDCPHVVGTAARWAAEVLLEAFAGYRAEKPPAEKPADAPGPKYSVHPVGWVRKSDGKTTIVVERKYQDALLGVEKLSEVWVLYWFDRNDTPEKRSILRVHPRGDPENPLTGVFGTRSPARPNLIALSRCKVLSVKENVIEIEDIDAFADTPVLDLKP